VTGRMEGPSLFHLMAVLGKERCVGRLRRAVAWLQSGAQSAATWLQSGAQSAAT
jgi:hypothetical protein